MHAITRSPWWRIVFARRMAFCDIPVIGNNRQNLAFSGVERAIFERQKDKPTVFKLYLFIQRVGDVKHAVRDFLRLALRFLLFAFLCFVLYDLLHDGELDQSFAEPELRENGAAPTLARPPDDVCLMRLENSGEVAQCDLEPLEFCDCDFVFEKVFVCHFNSPFVIFPASSVLAITSLHIRLSGQM